jgi:hypothetical protein
MSAKRIGTGKSACGKVFPAAPRCSGRMTGYASVTTYVLPARLWRGAPIYSLSNGRLRLLNFVNPGSDAFVR